MSVKNHVGHLRVHNKTNHTHQQVRSLSLGKIIGRLVRSQCFARMLQPYGINIGLKKHSNRVTHKVYTPKSPLGPLPPDSGPTQKTFQYTDSIYEHNGIISINTLSHIMNHMHFTYELCNTHNYLIDFKIILTHWVLTVDLITILATLKGS